MLIPNRKNFVWATRMGLFLFLFLKVLPAYAGEYGFKQISTPRFILYHESGPDAGYVGNVSKEALFILDSTFEELKRVLRVTPTRKIVLRFLSPKEFKELTGAPSWTNAMFFRGEITIPISTTQRMNRDELERALRHEYVHAVLAELSGFRIPAWLDEGIAQYIEGKPNKTIGPALRGWMNVNEPFPLTNLREGFLGFDPELVPAIYGQSLFATRSLINRRGMKSVMSYLEHLKSGYSYERSFELAFDLPQPEFEHQLAMQLHRWKKTSWPNP